MRLKVSRNTAEERLYALVDEGYEVQRAIQQEYTAKSIAGSFSEPVDIPFFRASFDGLCERVTNELNAIFSSRLESSYFNKFKYFMI